MGLKKVIFTSTVPAVKRKDVRVGVNKTFFWFAFVWFVTPGTPRRLYACPSTLIPAFQPKVYK